MPTAHAGSGKSALARAIRAVEARHHPSAATMDGGGSEAGAISAPHMRVHAIDDYYLVVRTDEAASRETHVAAVCAHCSAS